MKGGSFLRPSWAVAALFIPVTLLMLTSSGASSRHKMSQTAMAHATATAAGPGQGLTDILPGLQAVADFLGSEQAHVWFLSLVGSVAVGLSGIFPLLVIPIEAGAALKTEAGCQKLRQLLSFAIGGLLGDVFLHLLPEAWALSGSSGGKRNHYMTQGLWVIVGLLAFLLLEKMFPDQDSLEDPTSNSDLNFNCPAPSNSVFSEKAVVSLKNGHHAESWKSSKQQSVQGRSEKIKTSGYLNLLANCIDNFTHGLAVAGSFLVSKKVGFLTTFAILLHEIPHEVGDFAILLRAGFDRWSAARMQLSTALFGVLGACFALCTQSPKGTENATVWILPFTSGGFLYIALVNVVPDLLQESSLRNTILQILLIICGVAVMALLSAIID
ncbi:putative zinc transporter ZIP13 isoform 2 [Scophthalmus maximus]|uniref:Zinc transporter ZIP13 n=1 Tax=Scophthalmus maximus TaxID=52904 RepID=A0A2U9BC06_SCOMX|nr:zinc transporter ZIP13 [Scophthalmus maximus]XP_035483303.1 zinc transporter ZIP13 [Scophthalmus maximus]XP_035483304.1 zinc transporter ZIP13 [Scophthalmus maximus]AWP01487.1 putative zinc transporter ZIP13 [Scophthalmus maximus]AWP01488.1 putative zinc transporter ZIP13 isoform 2 [Scophthalmus maximus]